MTRIEMAISPAVSRPFLLPEGLRQTIISNAKLLDCWTVMHFFSDEEVSSDPEVFGVTCWAEMAFSAELNRER